MIKKRSQFRVVLERAVLWKRNPVGIQHAIKKSKGYCKS